LSCELFFAIVLLIRKQDGRSNFCVLRLLGCLCER